MQLTPGSRLSTYEIIAPLGAGGMGEVYRARDPALKRDVAIKVLPENWSGDPERLHRFKLETQATAALNHPNIVSIFHVGQHDGCPWIVTELLQGETLRDRLLRGPMRAREACDCGIEVARGLASAHDAGIVHRDLKPDNLFLTKDSRIKILDFGLAKFMQPEPAGADGATATLRQRTEPGQVSGTVGYMAPEQVRGHAADPRSDIFAFGVVLYEMLTGQRAFRKGTSVETLNAILNEEPPPLAQFEKKPERRFQHASDLAFALEALSDASGTAIAAPPQAAARNRWIWIAAAGVAVAAALVVWWRQPRAVPVVEAVTQLTTDGEVKANSGNLETDGSRIYFGEGTLGSYRIMQVAATGGPTAIIPTRLANFQFTALSHDGSYLLGAAGDAFVLPFWACPTAERRTASPGVHRGPGCRLISRWSHSILPGQGHLGGRERRLQLAQGAQCRRCASRTERFPGRKARRFHPLGAGSPPDLDRRVQDRRLGSPCSPQEQRRRTPVLRSMDLRWTLSCLRKQA